MPLTTSSLKPILAETILPLLLPLLTGFSVVMLGWPGVGKTLLFLTMVMAIGRYNARKQGANAEPGWRRSKALDAFRHRPGKMEEAIFLDDPSLLDISVADLKSFLDVSENGSTSGRYNDASYARGSMRGLADNQLTASLKRVRKENDDIRRGLA